ADGSGLSRANRASPAGVARLLERLREQGATFSALWRSLPVAGRDGTLRDRMRSGPARGRCRAKTGTLPSVSSLSGFCTSRAGHTIVFSFLMNGVSPVGARRLQDRMAHALAAYGG
nr:D-alanyl-D-alanine carboxypeptidase [Actinomycetota bacterium]